MKKLTTLLAALFAATLCVSAADFASLGLDVGYNNQYVVNGVSYAKETPYASLGALKSLKYADVYAGATLLTDEGKDQTYWLVGAGKNVYTYKGITARLDGTVQRNQTDSVGIPNSTEFGVKLAAQNALVTPYIRGIFNVDLIQNGYALGAERVQKLPFGFAITPSVEWGNLTDYSFVNVKGVLARPFQFAFGTVTPYASVGWYDNDINASKYKLATSQFNDEVVYTAGVKLTF